MFRLNGPENPPSDAAPGMSAERTATRHAPVKRGAAVRAAGLAVLAFAGLATPVLGFWATEWRAVGDRVSGPTLVGGLVAAAVAALAVFVAIWRQARQIAATRRHLEALEALQQLSAAVSGVLRGGDVTGRETLVELCSATLSLLDADRCGILVLDAGRNRMELLAAAGDLPPDPPRYYDLAELHACRSVLADRQVRFIEDTAELADGGAAESPTAASRAPSQCNQGIVSFYRARSIVLIPLELDGRCIGLLGLSGSAPRRYDDVDRRVAHLMGAQAAVILANARLIRQTRDAAQQARTALASYKAMLDVLQAGSFEESMMRIVKIAPAAVGVDRAGIGLTTDREGELVMVAHTGHQVDQLIGKPQDVSALNSGRALRERRTVVVTDAGRQGGVHPSVQQALSHASIVYAPLFAANGGDVVAPAGRPIGLLIFVRERPGEFSAEQMELMRAFCVRAAGIIETARLLERTRQDALTKSELLRELNHRVKNNLAGIVALLTVGRPPLTPEVELWLDRAIDRTRAMADAHDLFTGGKADVTLAGLLQQTLGSIPLPPGVTLRQDLDGAGDVRLDTGRALTLAMVVNELCHNAVTHGLGATGGTVEVTARFDDSQGDRVVVEIRDDGTGAGAGEGSSGGCDRAGEPGGTEPSDNVRRGGGVGLELVEGLVRRELRGTFLLNRNRAAGGGTTARVVFRIARTDDGPSPSVIDEGNVSGTGVDQHVRFAAG